VIHNRELIKMDVPLLDQAGLDADAAKNLGKRDELSRKQLRDVILEDYLAEEEDETKKDEVLDRIPMLHPAVCLFTSLAFRNEPFGASEDVRQEQLVARQKLLDSTGGYELLGTLELFLKAGSRAGLEELFRTLDGPDGLCTALWQVNRNQQSLATAAMKKKEVVASWKEQKQRLDSMRDSFKACLNQLAETFSRDYRAVKDKFEQEVRDEFERTCRRISGRRTRKQRVVSIVEDYFVNLQNKIQELLKRHVEALQESLGTGESSFRLWKTRF